MLLFRLFALLALTGPLLSQTPQPLPTLITAGEAAIGSQAIVFAPGAASAWVLEPDGTTLTLLNLDDARTGQSWSVSRHASVLAISPSGRWLALAMPKEVQAGLPEADVVLLDTLLGELRPPFHVGVFPSGMVITDAGLVVVSDALSQRRPEYWSLALAYNGLTGLELSSIGNNAGTSLALSVDQQSVFAAEYDMVRAFTLDAATGQLGFAGLSPQFSWPTPVMGVLYTLPDSVHLVSRGGWLHEGAGSGELLQSTHTVESVIGDQVNRAFFTLGVSWTDAALFQYHAETLQLGAHYQVPGLVRHVHRAGETLFLAIAETNRTVIYQATNPAAGGETNQAPVAAFTWTPAEPTTAETVTLDGSGATDDQAGALWYRWDWDGDGRFDTAWDSQPALNHRFTIGGNYSVRLEVKDRFGALSGTNQLLNVVTAPDPGIPVDPHEPFVLPFPCVDIAFDPNASVAYLAVTNTLRIVRLDLQTGRADRQYLLDKWPQRFALSPDGSKLYAPLWPSSRAQSSTGFVAEIHLPTASKLREFPVDAGFSLMLPGPDDLLIAGGSQNNLLLYLLGVANRLDARSAAVSQFARSPSPTNFYAFGTVLSHGATRYGVNATTGKIIFEGSAGSPSFQGNGMFPLPQSTNAISTAGRLLGLNPRGPANLDLNTINTFHPGWVDAVAFDPPRRAIFLLGTSSYSPPMTTHLYHYHLDSHLLMGTYAVTNGTGFLHVDAEFVYTAAVRTNETFFARLPNPAAGAESNIPPVASYLFSPIEATTLEPLAFDASPSSDEDGSASLLYRWDWDGDGHFETDFESRQTNTHRINLAGTHSIVLEVRDRFGAVSRATNAVNVQRVDDPGTSPDIQSPPFSLPFAPNAVVFDPTRPRMFATHNAGKELVRMDLTSGLVDRVYALDYYPDSLAITADGAHLAVATLHRTTYATVPPSPWKGFVAQFDLERDVKTHEFGLAAIPRSLALSSLGYAIIGSHQPSAVVVCRFSDGAESYRGWPYDPTLSTVHPDQHRFYAVTIDSSRHLAFRMEILDDGSITNHGMLGSEYLSEWIEMLGPDALISSAGQIVSCSPNPALDGQLLRSLNVRINDVATDPAHHAFFAVGHTWTGVPFLRLYNSSTFEAGREYEVPAGTRYVHATPQSLYWVTVNATEATVGHRPNPAAGGENNSPPTARFEFAPAHPFAMDVIRFDASSSSDDGGVADLRYRWDWDADGTFDTIPLTTSVVSNQFEFGGTRTVALQVIDGFGATNISEQTIEIAVPEQAWEPGVELTLTAADFLFHPTLPMAYAIDQARRRVVSFDCFNGLIQREQSFPHIPMSLALTPDTENLVVSLRRHSSTDVEGEGTIVVLDPETLAIRSEFDVAMDPEDILATDTGTIIAASGSGQWTAVRSFQMDTGAELGSSQIYYHGRLALHPSQQTFYVSTTAQNPPTLTRFDLNPSNGEITLRGSTGSANGAAFPAPSGTEMISASGTLLRTSNDAQDLQDIRQIAQVSFRDVHFDTPHDLIFAIGNPWVSLDTALLRVDSAYELVESVPVPPSTAYVHAAAPYLYTVEIESNRTVIRRRLHPTASIRLTSRMPAGMLELDVAGWPGTRFELATSTDLRNWTPVLTNALGSSPFTWTAPFVESGAVYFRAHLLD